MPIRNVCIARLFALLCMVQTTAHSYDALEACRSQSQLDDEIHDCLDTYLDLMDRNLNDLTQFIDGELRNGQRAAFNRAQNAFYAYRRENCLWYLDIATSRAEAEQVAKNCLAEMSQQRLRELQILVGVHEALGAEPVDESANEPTSLEERAEAVLAALDAEQPAIDYSSAVTENQPEGLSAYLGEWQVTCVAEEGARNCTLDVPLVSLGEEANDDMLRVTRRSEERAIVELRFPGQTIASPGLLSWRIDNFSFGPVPGSIVTVSNGVTRLVVNERRFIRDDLMPLFRSGTGLGVTILADVDDSSGEEYEATLQGFSRALSFADEYINDELQ